MKPKADLIIKNAAEVITCASVSNDPLGRISGGAVACGGDKILAVGSAAQVEARADLTEARVIEAGGKVVAPGFVDCHTHLVFGGSRSKEFALRMTRSVAEIEATGLTTGIPASIRMTRQAGEDDLFAQAMDRLGRMLKCGTTTVESKSGYGIRWADEQKALKVNRRLQNAQPMDVVSTFVGAHDFPPEIDRNDFKERRAYIDELINEMIPRVAEQGLAEACDIYLDDGYYTTDEAREILSAGKQHSLYPRMHTDCYSQIGGGSLAAELPAVSADHLNYTTPMQMEMMAKAGVVGVVLPSTDFAVAHPKPFEARPMLDAGMTLALATNLNPGNWTESMHFVMQLACRNHGMSPEEAMLAATTGAAKAIRRGDRIGRLGPGFQADIQIWDLPAFEDVIYRLAGNAVGMVIKNGKIVFNTQESC